MMEKIKSFQYKVFRKNCKSPFCNISKISLLHHSFEMGLAISQRADKNVIPNFDQMLRISRYGFLTL